MLLPHVVDEILICSASSQERQVSVLASKRTGSKYGNGLARSKRGESTLAGHDRRSLSKASEDGLSVPVFTVTVMVENTFCSSSRKRGCYAQARLFQTLRILPIMLVI